MITVVTDTRNLRTILFIQSDDPLSTGKQCEDWLERNEREFRYFRITQPENKKDALLIYGGQELNLRPVKGEFKTKVRNATCGMETKFIVIQGRINSPPLLSRATLKELGMIEISPDGSFAEQNDLKVTNKASSILLAKTTETMVRRGGDIGYVRRSTVRNTCTVVFSVSCGTKTKVQKSRPGQIRTAYDKSMCRLEDTKQINGKEQDNQEPSCRIFYIPIP
ncbi:unnamed protein product [Mytilus coruscus]|uniref:Uncharacterized protein n=1 Tax=Mytilus coruscus TaxID=42192 RepID=A0A6J8D6I9_MYTCO|nr:unnamed protein product [Mytilus coruscus]